jgi:hypothetical protein
MEGKLGRNCESKIDHGIASGLLLFNSLKYIRLNKLEELKSLGINGCVDGKNLYWGNDLDNFYYVASSSIAVHNIHRATQDTDQEKLYNDCKMSDLILGKNGIQKLSVQDDPFLFLLSIVDTIEPIKTFSCNPPQNTLESICIDFKNRQTIIISKKEASDIDFTRLKTSIKGLDNWLNITLSIEENSITIKINQ